MRYISCLNETSSQKSCNLLWGEITYKKLYHLLWLCLVLNILDQGRSIVRNRLEAILFISFDYFLGWRKEVRLFECHSIADNEY